MERTLEGILEQNLGLEMVPGRALRREQVLDCTCGLKLAQDSGQWLIPSLSHTWNLKPSLGLTWEQGSCMG